MIPATYQKTNAGQRFMLKQCKFKTQIPTLQITFEHFIPTVKQGGGSITLSPNIDG